MLVAKQKRKENIAEYILYMYQIEDLIRAFKFDINLINENLVANYKADNSTSKEIEVWYSNLVIMMDKEGIKEKGHIQFLKNQVNEIYDLHLKLVETEVDKRYVQIFNNVSGLIEEIKQKNKTKVNDVQLTFDTIYGFLLLKIKKAKISDATSEAITRLSQWLGILSDLFKKFEAGDLEI